MEIKEKEDLLQKAHEFLVNSGCNSNKDLFNPYMIKKFMVGFYEQEIGKNRKIVENKPIIKHFCCSDMWEINKLIIDENINKDDIISMNQHVNSGGWSKNNIYYWGK